MAKDKQPCEAVAGDGNGTYPCEKTGRHLVHKTGDTKYVGALGAPILYGPRK
jgi:hypothetical protein